ncbi:hypothetical protein [Conchiformibius kuhniae]|uniref:Uncharacterized protein n=1 Tax=Conchiformibius kuhniae TaxID=211502 RepID=A0A8T9MTD2_9NEIS|nr:hypothetical protein [Conchiformibius kuhniae]UOP04055.1 hypothetical protein LVJ77_06085 [Conchiformibius kuhniae]
MKTQHFSENLWILLGLRFAPTQATPARESKKQISKSVDEASLAQHREVDSRIRGNDGVFYIALIFSRKFK